MTIGYESPSDNGTAQSASTSTVEDPVRAELNRLRQKIDNIDAAVVHMLAERFKYTQQVDQVRGASCP